MLLLHGHTGGHTGRPHTQQIPSEAETNEEHHHALFVNSQHHGCAGFHRRSDGLVLAAGRLDLQPWSA